MSSPEILDLAHHFSDGLYAKEIPLKKGSFAVQHKHEYSHLSILAKGRVLVKIDESDDVEEFVAPACINIEAGKHHGIMALEDSVWFCIHATEETDLDKIDEVLIATGD